MKTSQTMRSKKSDNFSVWREQQKKNGKFAIKETLEKNGNFAELLGHIWGDGNIGVLARTECLRIVAPSKRPQLVLRTAELIEKVFGKKPSVLKRKNSECVNITLYQRKISARMSTPSGACKDFVYTVPAWIQKSKEYKKRLLRGLYETDGAHCIHKPTYTYKLMFTNANISLLDIVEGLLIELGFHPHRSNRKIQLSRKEEVAKAIKMMHFREY